VPKHPKSHVGGIEMRLSQAELRRDIDVIARRHGVPLGWRNGYGRTGVDVLDSNGYPQRHLSGLLNASELNQFIIGLAAGLDLAERKADGTLGDHNA